MDARPVKFTEKLAVPEPPETLLLDKVGFWLVEYTTPLSVTVSPFALMLFPPVVAEAVARLETAVVLMVGAGLDTACTQPNIAYIKRVIWGCGCHEATVINQGKVNPPTNIRPLPIVFSAKVYLEVSPDTVKIEFNPDPVITL